MNFEEFQRKLKQCRYCREKLKLDFEPKPLVWGNEKAKIVQISQAPSFNAGKCGRAFSQDENIPDASGKKLLEWYTLSKKEFYNPDNFYITAAAHCFPGKSRSGDAKPPMACAEKWLWEELSFLNPKIFIVVGRLAAGFLFPDRDFKELIYADNVLLNKPAFVLPHPSPVNKKWLKDNPDFEKKRLKKIRESIKNILGRIDK